MSKSDNDAALSLASATALRELRSLDVEVQTEGSEDVIKLRLAGVLRALAPLSKEFDELIGASADLTTASKRIEAALARSFPAPATTARAGGLASQPVVLQSFLEAAAQEHFSDWEEAKVTPAVIDAANGYDKALGRALDGLVKRHPPDSGATALDLWDFDAATLVLSTLRDHGVGIWAGDWDRFYEDTDAAEAYLKRELYDHANEDAAGSLDKAFLVAARAACKAPAEPEEDDEEDEDEDEDDEESDDDEDDSDEE